MIPNVQPKTLSFLRALKRNNDRSGFAPGAINTTRTHEPMVAASSRLAQDFAPSRPAHRLAEAVDVRIYRDTRFSGNKSR